MFIDCGQETQRGLDLNCGGRWLGWLNQGAYPEAKVILTQQVFTCTCVLAIFHRPYLNYVLSRGISSSVCTNLRLSIDRSNEAAELEVREIVVHAVLRTVHAYVHEALAMYLKCSLEIVTEKPANRDYGV